MNNVQNQYPWLYASMTPWGIVMAVVALSTYLLAGFGVGFYRKYKGQKRFNIFAFSGKAAALYRRVMKWARQRPDLESGKQAQLSR